jgi:hypothetical protein
MEQTEGCLSLFHHPAWRVDAEKTKERSLLHLKSRVNCTCSRILRNSKTAVTYNLERDAFQKNQEEWLSNSPVCRTLCSRETVQVKIKIYKEQTPLLIMRQAMQAQKWTRVTSTLLLSIWGREDKHKRRQDEAAEQCSEMTSNLKMVNSMSTGWPWSSPLSTVCLKLLLFKWE